MLQKPSKFIIYERRQCVSPHSILQIEVEKPCWKLLNRFLYTRQVLGSLGELPRYNVLWGELSVVYCWLARSNALNRLSG